MTFIPSVRLTNLDQTNIYLKGDDTTNDSIRLVFTEGDSVSHIELRTDGIWNDTGVRTAPKSLELGRDLFLSAGYSYIETASFSGASTEERTLVPHIEFHDSAEGSGAVHTPITKGLESFPIFTTPVSEVTSTTITQGFNIGFRRLIKNIQHEVGTTGATSEVTHSIYLGTDNTGFLISRFNTAPSEIVAESTWTLDFDYGLGIEANQPIFTEITSDTAFSLKTDTNGDLITTLNAQEMGELDMYTDNIVFNNSLDLVLTNDLNPIFGAQF